MFVKCQDKNILLKKKKKKVHKQKIKMKQKFLLTDLK